MENKPNRQKLSIDFESLFPGETMTIGNATILICPLNIRQIAIISKKIKSISSLFAKEGVTWENFTEKTSIFSIVTIILDTFPDILEEASNVDINDLQKLPLDKIIEIMSKIIEVNLKSKDDLTKNFKNLTEKLIEQVPTMDQAIPKTQE
jgi:hypothetical protein